MSELMQAEMKKQGQKWPMVKLGEVCHTVTKGTTPTSLGYEFSSEGIPFLRIQNISNNTVSLDDVLYIDEETNEALKRSKIIPGDLLITIAGTIGKTAIVPDDFPECNCNQALAIIRFDSKILWPKYLLYWLGTTSALSQIIGMKVTATISNLSLGQIKELVLALPPLEEQKRIAAILDKADAIRRKRQQAIKLADDFLRSVFEDLSCKPLSLNKSDHLETLYEWVRLSDVARLESGHTPSRKVNEYWGGNIKWLSLKDVKSISGAYLYDTSDKPTQLGIDNSSARLLPKNTVALCRTASVGKSVILGDEMATSQDFVNWVCSEKILPEFLYTTLQISGRFFDGLKQGSTHKTIYVPTVKDFHINLPPIEVQDKVAKALKYTVDFKVRSEAGSGDLSQLFSSISKMAFSGEL